MAHPGYTKGPMLNIDACRCHPCLSSWTTEQGQPTLKSARDFVLGGTTAACSLKASSRSSPEHFEAGAPSRR
jgi:hypothetical protein